MPYQLPYTDGDPRLPVTTKCPECKKPTDQEFIVIAPVNDEDGSMAIIQKARRLVVCTECGNLRLVK